MAKAIGDELAAAVLRTKSLKAYMLDSTQLQAGRYVEGADHNPHYEIRMDKAHILMAGRHPLFIAFSDPILNFLPR